MLEIVFLAQCHHFQWLCGFRLYEFDPMNATSNDIFISCIANLTAFNRLCGWTLIVMVLLGYCITFTMNR